MYQLCNVFLFFLNFSPPIRKRPLETGRSIFWCTFAFFHFLTFLFFSFSVDFKQLRYFSFLYKSMYYYYLNIAPDFMYLKSGAHSKLAKITIHFIQHLYPITSSPTGWTTWPIDEVHISNLNWEQIFPFQYPRIIHIHLNNTYVKFSSLIFQ